MRVLVSGAGGFLGRYVVDRLVRGGHSVRAIVRPASLNPEWKKDVEVFRADLRADKLEPAFDGIDAVLHLAAATSGSEDMQFASSVVATERFLDAMNQSLVKRLVHVSSLVVYDWRYAKGLMDENTHLLEDIYEMDPYTIAKVWQERVVNKYSTANGWHLTILRPGFIWGPQHAVIAGMGRRFGRVNLMFGPLTRLPLCHVVNCADCLVSVVENPATIGQNFNVIDGDDIRVLRYVREFARRGGKTKFLLAVPYRLGYGLARFAAFTSRALFGKNGKLPSLLTPRRFEAQFKPVRFSNQKLTKFLSWKPPLNFAECLKMTYSVDKY